MVGDTGDGHFGFKSDVWAAQSTHTASPSRGRRFHDTRGPRDAVPHREAAQAPLCHRLSGVGAQHRPGLHAAGGPGTLWRVGL